MRPIRRVTPLRLITAAGVVVAAGLGVVLTAAGTPAGTPAATSSGTTAGSPFTGPVGGPQLGVTGTPVVGETAPELPEVDAKAWLVADAETGAVLAALDAHARLPPASTIKLLTAIALLPRIDPDLTYTATDADAGVEGSRVGLAPEQTYTMRDLQHGLMLASGNDAAYALGELVGGQDAAIVAMNTEAARLGAFHTTALTTHGLDQPGQLSSAYDLALIARAALLDADVATLARTTAYDFPGLDATTFQIQNQNRLLGSYDGAIGLKTGYTSVAGHTLVAAAERDGIRLIVTVLSAEGRAEPAAEALLDWGFAAAGAAEPVGSLVTPGEVETAVEAAAEAAAEREASGAPGESGDGPSATGTGGSPAGVGDLARVAARVPLWGWGGLGGAAALGWLLARRRASRREKGRYAV